MKVNVRKLTVTLEVDIARWLKREAVRENTSISYLLGKILKERIHDQKAYERAMRQALTRKPFLKTDRKYLARDAAHDRAESR